MGHRSHVHGAQDTTRWRGIGAPTLGHSVPLWGMDSGPQCAATGRKWVAQVGALSQDLRRDLREAAG